ncbi:peptidase M15 [Leptospira gomenensis]|uniref:Peptidase M15 n=1 Tax=Leptospira gomenensis TaxID=2484974 RepID=A0A5F1YP84_9LEPT|nr:D-Ala-D-Ala carboxypeptidase family metallohydrolase [Leptospira gomenensis]TGK35012.1 peptidase M15 [Leptospira gomenensis]TGK35310.1 peptidase M15 [Leptospira gomenensis]TGK51795.1 peptidase M15 [Leptospira gomenensis]TGK58390.1 peptidase M15 [Leptospira gomenensis]
MSKLTLKTISSFVFFLFSCDFQPHTPPSEKQWIEFKERPGNKERILALETFLKKRKLSNVVPVEQLLRQGTDWRQAKAQPFAIPPRSLWPNILPTLRVIRDLIVPSIGSVTVVSGFRESEYNEKAGGAKSSRHRLFSALDMIPDRKTDRHSLTDSLLELWQQKGSERKIGLGLYSRNRFHIDTNGFRKWEK